MTNLLKDGGWRPPPDPDVLTAVDKLKEALISSPVLAFFDVNAVATDLYCDASGGSIGAVLQQTDKDGEVRPVGFYSRKLTPADAIALMTESWLACVTAVCIFGISS